MPGLAPGIASRGETARLAIAAGIHVAFGVRSITSRDNMARTAVKKIETSTSLLEAAKKVLRHAGYAGLSTREVAAEAGVPLSQIHYHFGSKQNLVLQLFEYLNAQLLDRQHRLFGDPSLKLSEQWDRACDYLDEDIASGYVRVLQELIAVSWHDAEVAKVIRAGIMGWVDLIVGLAKAAEAEDRPARPLLGGGSRRDRRLQLHRGRKPVPARPGEEGLADPRIASSRRRPDPDCGRILVRQKVKHARKNAGP
jgi:AcrR family transcriptional regulator